MKWTIIENEACSCDGLSVDMLPEKLPKKLHVLYKNNNYLLKADGIAGIIACPNGNNIVIEPKCNKLRPFAMYEYINRLFKTTNTNTAVDLSGKDGDLNIIARIFAQKIIDMQCYPRMIKRLPSKDTRSSVKGHVDWVESAKRLAIHSINPIVSVTREATVDIPENQIISKAAKACLSLFSKDTLEWKALSRWSRYTYERDIYPAALIRIRTMLKNGKLSGAHAYYRDALALSLILLGVDQAGLVSSEDNAILFNMPNLYEDYIRTAFMRASIPKGYSCQKSFSPSSFLFTDGTCELEPDITIYRGITPIAVLDVKYKEIDSKDYYQLFTYMKFAGLQEAYFVSPYVKDGAALNIYDGQSKINMINVSESNNHALEKIASDIIGSL